MRSGRADIQGDSREGLGETGDAAGDPLDLRAVQNVRADHGELVAAQPGNGIVGAYGCPAPTGDLPEHGVLDSVAVGVVADRDNVADLSTTLRRLLGLVALPPAASLDEIAAHDRQTTELARYKLGRHSSDDADG